MVRSQQRIHSTGIGKDEKGSRLSTGRAEPTGTGGIRGGKIRSALLKGKRKTGPLLEMKGTNLVKEQGAGKALMGPGDRKQSIRERERKEASA